MGKSAQSSSSKTITQPRKLASEKRLYTYVTDEMRRNLISTIQEENISCRMAAKKLGITYNNAKVIYRVYRKEGRTKATPKHLKRLVAKFNRDPKLLVDQDEPKVQELMDFIKTKTDLQSDVDYAPEGTQPNLSRTHS